MSEGTAVAYVCRYLINDAGTGLLQVEAGLSGVRVIYRPENLDDYVADNGRIEAIYWGEDGNTDVAPRAFKGGNSIKYAENADRELVIFVTAKDKDDSGSDVEERAANLLGEVIKVLQESQPPSPGSHLTNIRIYVSNWDSRIGRLSRGGTKVHAISYSVTVNIQSNVEQ